MGGATLNCPNCDAYVLPPAIQVVQVEGAVESRVECVICGWWGFKSELIRRPSLVKLEGQAPVPPPPPPAGPGIAIGICVAWPSTVASIPTGWTRETALDARYILGAGTGANTDLSTDRGATTHTHTSPAHTPVQDSHVHAFRELGNSVTVTILGGGLGGTGASATHGHVDADSNAQTAVNNSSTITVEAATNDLAYTEVIWIKSDGTPLALPSGCYAWFESDSLPSGWTRVKGDRYLKGAAAASDPAADGGSNTHTHTSPAHTHTQVSHQHTGASGGPDTTQILKGVTGSQTSSAGHSHAVTLSSLSGSNQSVTTTITAGDGQPPFKKLNIVSTGADSLPTSIIALWLGTNALIPAGWTRYTGMDGKWLKGANANGESGVTTGGGSQHSHTASDCQPIQNSHTHVIVDAVSANVIALTTSSSDTWPDISHRHGDWQIDSATPTNQAVAVTVDDCTADAALPQHRTVIYVRLS